MRFASILPVRTGGVPYVDLVRDPASSGRKCYVQVEGECNVINGQSHLFSHN